MKEGWLEAINEEIRETKRLTLETRRMADAAEKRADAAMKEANAAMEGANAAMEEARAATSQAQDSRFLLEEHIAWHYRPIWKRWFGLK